MDRDQALGLVQSLLTNKNLVRHCLAVEAIMRRLCVTLRERHPELPASEFDEEEWALVGLLHDADYEVTEKDLARHTLVIVEKAAALGASARLTEGIKSHSEQMRASRDNYMEKAIYAADELSGLITAVALVKPDKKLASVTVDSVMHKFPSKTFAAGARRDQILTCGPELGIPLEEFIGLALSAMQSVAGELGL